MKTYWDNEPMKCEKIQARVTGAPSNHLWYASEIGNVIELVKVYTSPPLFLNNSDDLQLGWWKVTEGRGKHKYGHHSIPEEYFEEVSIEDALTAEAQQLGMDY